MRYSVLEVIIPEVIEEFNEDECETVLFESNDLEEAVKYANAYLDKFDGDEYYETDRRFDNSIEEDYNPEKDDYLAIIKHGFMMCSEDELAVAIRKNN